MLYTQPNDHPDDKAWQAVKELKRDIPGLLFGREVRYLYTTAERVGPGLYADLGTFRGLSTAALAKGIVDYGVNANLFSFDTFEGTGVSSKFLSEDGTEEAVRRRLETLEVDHVVDLVPGYFSDSVELFTGPYRFIFIDGSHDYKSVKEDFENWSPLLAVGGELAFHDSNIKSPNKEVWKLMEELEDDPQWEKFAVERTLTAWKKVC